METISNQLKGLSLSQSSSNKTPFADYFPRGSGADLIFREHVIPFLTLQDLVVASQSCRRMNNLCRTYTIGEILEKHSMDDKVSRNLKLKLGKFVIGFVSPTYRNKYNKKAYDPKRLVCNARETFRAKLYHPSTIPDILLAMTAFFTQHGIPFENTEVAEYDWEKANSNPSTPVLISAEYGASEGTTNVTLILRYLLMRESNLRLILKKPVNGPQYWYNYLFGDPCYGTTKSLWVTMRMPNGQRKAVCYSEDTSISIPLRAETVSL